VNGDVHPPRINPERRRLLRFERGHDYVLRHETHRHREEPKPPEHELSTNAQSPEQKEQVPAPIVEELFGSRDVMGQLEDEQSTRTKHPDEALEIGQGHRSRREVLKNVQRENEVEGLVGKLAEIGGVVIYNESTVLQPAMKLARLVHHLGRQIDTAVCVEVGGETRG
jgi:hypothetical protein